MIPLSLPDAYAYSSERVFHALASSRSAGLTNKEAAVRRAVMGENTLPESSQALQWLKLFLRQWKSPLLWLLLIAALVSIIAGEITDAIVIVATGLINACVGFYQEYTANRTLRALSRTLEIYATVLRNGAWIQVTAPELVVGDVIAVSEGDGVSADARLVIGSDIMANEAALTGESTAVAKHARPLSKNTHLAERHNMLFSGTTIARGRAEAIVTATGARTEIGRIATLVVRTPDEPTPLQRELVRLARAVLVLVAIVCALVLSIGVLQERPVVEILVLSIALAVAAIPEGLGVTLTVVLSIGMRRMLRARALVRRLICAETLGSVDVLCVDKTGTITQGNMRVAQCITAEEIFSEKNTAEKNTARTRDEMVAAFALATEARVVRDGKRSAGFRGEATEVALVSYATEAGVDQDALLLKRPRIAEIMFDHRRRYMATMHRARGAHIVYAKGAFEALLPFCASRANGAATSAITARARETLRRCEEQLTGRGCRVLAVAMASLPVTVRAFVKSSPPPLVFLGFVALTDPVRVGVPEMITTARGAGVRTVMVTGDHVLTAIAVAREIGLEVAGAGAVVTGAQLSAMRADAQSRAINRARVFARIEPRQKLMIVQTLMRHGHVVAMTGDGVNDAPALKAADIGVAVGSGAMVAKEAADLIVLDDTVKTIINAIKEGRVIFDNIRSVILYLLSNMFAEVILVAGSLVFFLPLPITAVQILWINIVTDIFPAVALAFDPPADDVLAHNARLRSAPLLDQRNKQTIFVVSIIADVVLFLFFWSIANSSLATATIQTMMFAALSVGTLLYVHAIRNHGTPILKKFTNNGVLVCAQIAGFLLLLAAIYVPALQHALGTVVLGLVEWVVIGALSVVKLLLMLAAQWSIRIFYGSGRTVRAIEGS